MNKRTVVLGLLGVAAVVLLMLPHISTGDLVLAAVAALGGLAFGFVRPPPARDEARSTRWQHAWRIVPLLAYVLVDVAQGSWRVARLTFGRKKLPPPAIVEVGMGDRSPRNAAITGLLVTLSPGTVLIDVDEKRGIMIFHIVGLQEKAFRRGIERLHETWLRFLVP